MEKIEKIFDSAWGLVVFYLLVAIISIGICKSINNNIITNNVVEERSASYYA